MVVEFFLPEDPANGWLQRDRRFSLVIHDEGQQPSLRIEALDEGVHVVGHETIGMNCKIVFLRCLMQEIDRALCYVELCKEILSFCAAQC